MKYVPAEIGVEGLPPFALVNGTAPAVLIPAAAPQFHMVALENDGQWNTALEGCKIHPVTHHRLHCLRGPGRATRQIPQRFVCGVGNPHRREVAGALATFWRKNELSWSERPPTRGVRNGETPGSRPAGHSSGWFEEAWKFHSLRSANTAPRCSRLSAITPRPTHRLIPGSPL